MNAEEIRTWWLESVKTSNGVATFYWDDVTIETGDFSVEFQESDKIRLRALGVRA